VEFKLKISQVLLIKIMTKQLQCHFGCLFGSLASQQMACERKTFPSNSPFSLKWLTHFHKSNFLIFTLLLSHFFFLDEFGDVRQEEREEEKKSKQQVAVCPSGERRQTHNVASKWNFEAT
jgi:hypothetical protein